MSRRKELEPVLDDEAPPRISPTRGPESWPNAEQRQLVVELIRTHGYDERWPHWGSTPLHIRKRLIAEAHDRDPA
jgi:hypothetical protein